MTPKQFTTLFPHYQQALTIVPVVAGWSDDFKFQVVLPDKTSIIKVAPHSAWENKERIAAIVRKFNTLSYPMARLQDMSWSSDKAWLALEYSWVEGENLGEILPTLPEKKAVSAGGTSR